MAGEGGLRVGIEGMANIISQGSMNEILTRWWLMSCIRPRIFNGLGELTKDQEGWTRSNKALNLGDDSLNQDSSLVKLFLFTRQKCIRVPVSDHIRDFAHL